MLIDGSVFWFLKHILPEILEMIANKMLEEFGYEN